MYYNDTDVLTLDIYYDLQLHINKHAPAVKLKTFRFFNKTRTAVQYYIYMLLLHPTVSGCTINKYNNEM